MRTSASRGVLLGSHPRTPRFPSPPASPIRPPFPSPPAHPSSAHPATLPQPTSPPFPSPPAHPSLAHPPTRPQPTRPPFPSPPAPHLEEQHDVAEVGPLDLWDRVLLELVVVRPGGVQPEAFPRADTSSPASALVCRRFGALVRRATRALDGPCQNICPSRATPVFIASSFSAPHPTHPPPTHPTPPHPNPQLCSALLPV